ncbi:MAG: outer membrane protein assembly factor BamA [Bacteroidota bacterium]
MKKIFTLLTCLLLLAPVFVRAQVKFGGTRSSGANDALEFDYASPKEYVIADITVSGSKFLDANSLISLSGLKKGDKIRIPGEDISTAIKKLWDQGLLGGVEISATKIEGENVFLDIMVKERPRLSRFTFTGIKKGDSEALTKKVSLIRGRVVTDALVKNTQLQVKKYYLEKGYLNTVVNITQVADTVLSNSIVMKINVDKKHKVKIHLLAFNGREAIKEKKLRKKMKGTKQKAFHHVFTPSKFIPSKYEEDKKKLIAYYNSQGYRDMAIVSDTVYKHDNKTVNVELNIDEGKKYYFRDITWSGNYVYKSDILSEVLGIKKGDVYNLEELEQRLNYSPTTQDITSLYMDFGYLFFNIEPVEVAVDGDSIDIEMRIYEGAQANINKIILNGNTQTNDHVVLREIRTLPGQKFSRAALIRTQREIATLGYFDPEKIGINPIPNPQDGTVDIEYTVQEKPSDQVELSGGWGGYYGFVGTLGLVFNNFSARDIFKFSKYHPVPKGDGQRVALRFQASGKQYQTYSATFTEPWLGGKKPNSFSVSLSHTVINNYFTNTGGVSTDKNGGAQITGVTFSLGRRLQKPDDFFNLSNSISYQRYLLQNYGLFSNDFKTGTSNSVVFNTTLARNSIDNLTFPRSGSSFSLSLSVTPPYSLLQKQRDFAHEPNSEKFKFIEYHKWMFDATWYTSLIGKLVLSTRVHMGFLGNYNKALGFSPFERFVMGGSGMSGQTMGNVARDMIGLRGYQDNSVGPQNPLGGVVYDKFVLEARYPISLNPSATIFVLGFAEAGNNWGNYQEYNPLDVKRSAGFGARIFMPAFGLIGIDYGWGFDRPGGVGGQFHFTIGQQFR